MSRKVDLAIVLQEIGWTWAEVGRRVDMPPMTMTAWKRDQSLVPPAVIAWLFATRDAIRANPAPRPKRRLETFTREVYSFDD